MPRARLLVTGGSGEIATALIESRLAAGTAVVSLDVRTPAAASELDFRHCDLTDFTSIDTTVSALARDGIVLDGVVHCAGAVHGKYLEQEQRADWLRVMNINLIGTMGLTQRLLPLLADGASIVFLSSATVYKGLAAHTAYIASKAGIIGFARSLAAEVGERGIRANVVAPGLVATALTPDYADREPGQIASRALKRRQEASDVIGAIEFFLSPASAFITGQTLVVDGGSVRH